MKFIDLSHLKNLLIEERPFNRIFLLILLCVPFFLAPFIFGLPILFATTCLIVLCIEGKKPLLACPPVFVLNLLLFVGLSLFWSPNPGTALGGGVKVSFFLLGSCFVINALRLRQDEVVNISRQTFSIFCLFSLGLFIGLFYVLYCLNIPRFSLRYLSGGMGVVSLFMWVWVDGLRLDPRYLGLSCVVPPLMFYLCYLLDLNAGELAIFAGTVVYVGSFFWPRVMTLLLVGGLILGQSTVVLIVKFFLNPQVEGAVLMMSSWRHRLYVWQFVSEKILEKPFFGWGLGSSKFIPGGKDNIPALWEGATWLPLHPHNIFLQIWLELGAVGALICVGSIISISRFLLRNPKKAPLLNAMLVGYGVVSSTSFSVWQSWWMAGSLLSMITAIWLLSSYKELERQ